MTAATRVHQIRPRPADAPGDHTWGVCAKHHKRFSPHHVQEGREALIYYREFSQPVCRPLNRGERRPCWACAQPKGG